MITTNYKGEKFHLDGMKLFKELDSICQSLKDNFKKSGKFHSVKSIMDSSFNELWDLKPNNEDNKWSKNEFKGIYAFVQIKNGKVEFKYIGISQRIRNRFWEHTKRKRKSDASWAYLMSKEFNPGFSKLVAENKIPFYQKKHIHPLYFTFVPIDDNMLLHIAEVYCVNKLRSYWNTFETH